MFTIKAICLSGGETLNKSTNKSLKSFTIQGLHPGRAGRPFRVVQGKFQVDHQLQELHQRRLARRLHLPGVHSPSVAHLLMALRILRLTDHCRHQVTLGDCMQLDPIIRDQTDYKDSVPIFLGFLHQLGAWLSRRLWRGELQRLSESMILPFSIIADIWNFWREIMFIVRHVLNNRSQSIYFRKLFLSYSYCSNYCSKLIVLNLQ